MRFLVIVKATEDTEAGILPGKNAFAEMERFNEELVKAGVLLAAEGLKPSSQGIRVRFKGRGKTKVTQGPFAHAEELVAGYWLWETSSLEGAIEWVKRAPFDREEIEIRPLYEAAEFASVDPTGEILDKEEELRRLLERRKSGRAA